MLPKAELVRLAVEVSSERSPKESPRRVLLDREGRLPGRGAYLCREGAGRPRESCLELALKRGALARGLRCAKLYVESI